MLRHLVVSMVGHAFRRMRRTTPDDSKSPKSPESPNSLDQALAAFHRGDLAEAERQCRLLLSEQPAHGEALGLLGIVATRSGRHEEAVGLLTRAVHSNPDLADTRINLGAALAAVGRYDAAIESYDRAIALHAGSAQAWTNRGLAQAGAHRCEAALESYARAIALDPTLVEAHFNQGNALTEADRLEAALQSYDRAIALDPRHADAHYNRAIVLGRLGRHAEALESYERAVALDPGHSRAQLNLALCRLLQGDFSRGWPAYEWRWSSPDAKRGHEDLAAPLWLGKEALAGKTILLHAEQGFGDTLQFCRYAKTVAALGARVILEVQAPLRSLLSSLEGVSHLLAKGEPLPALDFHCPLGSLPLALKTTLDTLPAHQGYLRADPLVVDRWRRKLGPKVAPRVGLVWKGTNVNPRRSIPLPDLRKIMAKEMQFVCLQKEIGPEDRALLEKHGDIAVVSDELTDFSDTAAVVELVDLLVTIDTSVANLAGALGAKVWVLLPFDPDWRWMLGRPDSPWYPTARLFRQSARDDWTSVLDEVADALEREFAGGQTAG